MIAILFALVVVLVLVLVASVVVSTVAGSRSDPDEWARANGVVLSPATRPVVRRALRTGRMLRLLGALGGLVLPPAITAGTGIDLHLSGIVWVLVGYLAGQVVAELTLARVPADDHRAASLDTRRLPDYLPRPLLLAQVVLPIGALVAAGVLVATDDPAAAAPVVDSTLAGAVLAGPIAILLASMALMVERSLVRRPQPVVEAELVALDDAMRSSSIRTVSATSALISALLIANQLAVIALNAGAGNPQLVFGLSAAATFALAYGVWQVSLRRGWHVRRLRSIRTSEVPS